MCRNAKPAGQQLRAAADLLLPSSSESESDSGDSGDEAQEQAGRAAGGAAAAAAAAAEGSPERRRRRRRSRSRSASSGSEDGRGGRRGKQRRRKDGKERRKESERERRRRKEKEKRQKQRESEREQQVGLLFMLCCAVLCCAALLVRCCAHAVPVAAGLGALPGAAECCTQVSLCPANLRSSPPPASSLLAAQGPYLSCSHQHNQPPLPILSSGAARAADGCCTASLPSQVVGHGEGGCWRALLL